MWLKPWLKYGQKVTQGLQAWSPEKRHHQVFLKVHWHGNTQKKRNLHGFEYGVKT